MGITLTCSTTRMMGYQSDMANTEMDKQGVAHAVPACCHLCHGMEHGTLITGL